MPDEIERTLRALPHFGGLDDATLRRLAAASRVLRPEAGALIVHEGEPCHGFFAVRRGAVRVFRVAEDGRVQVLHRLGPGHTFAEAAVLNMGRYPASAEAVGTDVELVEIGAETFLSLFDADRRVPRAMVASLCGWLRTLLGRVDELSVASASARLARYLLELPARETEAGLRIELPTTKRAVAERLGITPETLSRRLRGWQEEGVLVSDRGGIVLLRPDALLAAAAGS